MKRRIATLVFLAAAAAAQAEVVGVMADSATGAIYPASVESRVSPTVLELDMAPGVFVTVQGLVQSVYSDAEQNQEENIRFDANFPASRLTWEDWRGPITQITTDPDDGYSGTFDAAIPPQVTNGCCFFVEEESPPVAHFISAIGDNNSATFSPALESNATYSVSAIRSAVCDAFGLHSGDTTGEDAWKSIQTSPIFGSVSNPGMACSADGRVVYKTTTNSKVWRSRDGGDSWEEIAGSPTLGERPALACSADGRVVYKTAANSKVWRSRDGADSWEEIAGSPNGSNPGMACSADGRVVYKTTTNSKVWRSRDGADSWEEIAGAPTLGSTYTALACSADGRVVYKTAANYPVYKSTPRFGTSASTAFTVLIDAVPRAVEQVKDFYAVDLGEKRTFWALRTGENRFSVYDTGTDPIGWYDIAWEADGTWYIRTTNGPAATAASTAPEAVSAAVGAWNRNRALEWQYQPHYGYARFAGGTNVEWALTFVPDANAVTNAPGVSGMGVLFSAFGDTPHWDTDAFRIDIVSTNPTVSKVTWAGDVATHATIRYIPEE